VKKTSLMKKTGFTLIELLIVVAIIAILAAIAVPNFLEAQVRAKVSRAKADMRTYATGIESYYIDNNNYPMIIAPNSAFLGGAAPASGINGPSIFNPGVYGVSSRFIWITTPIAYITSVFRDPFVAPTVGVSLNPDGSKSDGYDGYDYVDAKTLGPGGRIGGTRAAAICSGAAWHIVSSGPDRINGFGGGTSDQAYGPIGVDYDPSNGTLSTGDIVRIASGLGVLADGGPLPAIDRIKNEYNF
jgi:general secretion pathway protein G